MKIVTDCAADLKQEEAESLDIQIAPRIPTTSQPSTGIFTGIYKKLVEIGEEVISIHISSGLSGTLASAHSGAAQLPGRLINMVDSLTLSGGERFQMLAAALSAKAGRKKEYILDRLSKIRAATEVVYTLETLEYLQRRGRIGRVQALAGALLHIKPIIHVDKSDGKYSTIGKERTLPKALEGIANHIAKVYGKDTPLWVSVMHGQLAEQANKLAELVQEKVNVGKLEILHISPVLGVHTGPGIVGLAVIPIYLMEGLD